jgi:hypothetical protein
MKYNKYKYFIAITISISQYILLADLNISVKKKKIVLIIEMEKHMGSFRLIDY